MHTVAPHIHADTGLALLAYMTDCQFNAAQLNATCLSLALEYVYRPLPRFWQEFDIGHLITAIDRRLPNWRLVLEHTTDDADKLLREVEDYVRLKAFDETNAEMIRALPAHERPLDGASASAWISSELARNGRTAELEFAQRDDGTCGDHALEALHGLEEAAVGRTFVSRGAFVAGVYRDAIMKMTTEAIAI